MLLTLGLLIYMLATNKAKPAILFGGTLILFYWLDLLSTKELLENFSNEALATLVLLMVLSPVMERTSFIHGIKDKIFSTSNQKMSLLKLVSFSSIFSAFLNNTAVVAMLMGAIKQNRRVVASKFLIPLSYAAIIGGTATLIGTSTNLIVYGFAIDHGINEIGIFDFAYVGIPVMFISWVYLVLFSPNILPDNKDETEDKQHYLLEAVIESGSPLIDKSVYENGLRHMQNLFLTQVVRGEDVVISPVSPATILREGDILLFSGDVKNFEEIASFEGLRVFDSKLHILKENYVEVIVSHRSNLIGEKIKNANFRSKFDAAVIAVNRGAHKVEGKIGEIRITAGDTLVLAIGNDFKKRENLNKNFYLVTEIDKESVFSTAHSYIIFGAFLFSILLSAFKIVPLFKALLSLLFFFFILEFITFSKIKNSIPFEIAIVVGSALGIADVMINSGAADVITYALSTVTQSGTPWMSLTIVYLATLALTEIITNNAAAALAFPIGYATAISLDVSPLPFVMAVAFGASASFITPYGYQTNLMVYNYGSYKFIDYIKVGLPLSLLYSITVVGLIPIFFKF